MELIRISDNKVKIMLSAVDMRAYDLPTESPDCCESTVREAFRAVLRDAGRKSGIDFSEGRLSIQLYPSKSGGCEMFVTRSDLPSTEIARKKERSSAGKTAGGENEKNRIPHWESADAFGFSSMEWLLSACSRLHRIGFGGNSAAFRDEKGNCFLVIDAFGSQAETSHIRPLLAEYGTPENASAVRLYISEHGKTICGERAVETLGIL